jgi:WD40 repeat protein
MFSSWIENLFMGVLVMKRLVVVCVLLLMSAALIVPGMAAAQNAPVQLIPVTGEQVISALSPDGHTLAVIDNINLHNNYEVIPLHLPIQLVNLDTGKVLWLSGFTDNAWDVAFTPDGARLVSLHGNGEIFVWDIASRTEIEHFWGLPGMRGIAILPDGNTAIIRLPTLWAQLNRWDLTTGYITAVWTLHYDTYAEFNAQMSSGGIPEGIVSLTSAPDGTWLAVASTYGRIWHWDVATGEPTVLVNTQNTLPMFNIRSLHFTADGSALIYLDNQADVINVVDTSTGTVKESIPANTRFDPAVSADGSRIIWLDKDSGTLKQWQNGTLSDLPVDLSSVSLPDGVSMAPSSLTPALFLTPDGKRLIFAGFYAPDIGANVIAVIDLTS